MTAVYKRELRSYFNSMTGYVFIAAVTAFIGIYFMLYNLKIGHPYFAVSLSGAITIFAFAVPILTMKSMAEERHSKTDQMLLTYPVSVTGVIMGKFLAMLTVYCVPMLIACLCPLVISRGGNGSFLIDYSAILLFVFLGAMFISIGLFISSLTESQIIAAVASMAILLLLLIWDTVTAYLPSTVGVSAAGFLILAALFALAVYKSSRCIIPSLCIFAAGAVFTIVGAVSFSEWFSGALSGFLSLFSIYGPIANFTSYYVFDVKGLIFYAAASALFIFLTVMTVQKRRYR